MIVVGIQKIQKSRSGRKIRYDNKKKELDDIVFTDILNGYIGDMEEGLKKGRERMIEAIVTKYKENIIACI